MLLDKRINVVKNPPDDALFWFHNVRDAVELGWYKQGWRFMIVYVPTEMNNAWEFAYAKVLIPLDMICTFLWVKQSRLRERKKLSEYNMIKIGKEYDSIKREIEKSQKKLDNLEEERKWIIKKESQEAKRYFISSWKAMLWNPTTIMNIGKRFFKKKKGVDIEAKRFRLGLWDKEK